MQFGVVNHVPPTGSEAGESKALLGFAGPRLDVVGAHHEPRTDSALREAIGCLQIRTTVSRSHPACADQPNANDLSHLEWFRTTVAMIQSMLQHRTRNPGLIGIWQHRVTHQAIEIVTSGDKLS